MHIDHCHNHCNWWLQIMVMMMVIILVLMIMTKMRKIPLWKRWQFTIKGAFLPFLWVPTIAPASNHQIHKSPTNVKKFIFWKMNTYQIRKLVIKRLKSPLWRHRVTIIGLRLIITDNIITARIIVFHLFCWQLEAWAILGNIGWTAVNCCSRTWREIISWADYGSPGARPGALPVPGFR